MIVTFTKGWQSYNAGEDASFPAEVSELLVQTGVAVLKYPNDPAVKKTKPAKGTIEK
ncbi:hypothetical protein [Roseicella sp. DB1501]|uniref:hypothetical protein n=1 Tax=Roseicella sp. DB1501 TaxID=2730925 RepID=UPI001491DA4D|nr:hypothetical protein [Roseicella sp. DB1501]NOG69805.1 hypothetical protein [Roseicella sp. DB1501]